MTGDILEVHGNHHLMRIPAVFADLLRGACYLKSLDAGDAETEAASRSGMWMR